MTGKTVGDGDTEIRMKDQLPALLHAIQSHPFFGVGVRQMGSETFGNDGLFDIPLLGTLAGYGLVGMCLYYLRYLILVRAMKLFDQRNGLEPLASAFVGFFAAMIFFRMFYASHELVFTHNLAHFSLLAGAMCALLESDGGYV